MQGGGLSPICVATDHCKTQIPPIYHIFFDLRGFWFLVGLLIQSYNKSRLERCFCPFLYRTCNDNRSNNNRQATISGVSGTISGVAANFSPSLSTSYGKTRKINLFLFGQFGKLSYLCKRK